MKLTASQQTALWAIAGAVSVGIQDAVNTHAFHPAVWLGALFTAIVAYCRSLAPANSGVGTEDSPK